MPHASQTTNTLGPRFSSSSSENGVRIELAR
jgi:hypothetical protein